MQCSCLDLGPHQVDHAGCIRRDRDGSPRSSVSANVGRDESKDGAKASLQGMMVRMGRVIAQRRDRVMDTEVDRL